MRRCANCGRSLEGRVPQARTCSNHCKLAFGRRRKGHVPALELAALWRALVAEHGPERSIEIVRHQTRELGG